MPWYQTTAYVRPVSSRLFPPEPWGGPDAGRSRGTHDMLDAMGLEVCAERVCRELVASCETAADKSTAAALGGWIVFEDECGQFMRLRSRTWGRRGITPVIRVRGGTGHVSVAGLACYRPGHRIRLIRWLHCYRGRKGRSQGVHLGQVPGPAYRCLAGTGLTLDQIEHPTDAKN